MTMLIRRRNIVIIIVVAAAGPLLFAAANLFNVDSATEYADATARERSLLMLLRNAVKFVVESPLVVHHVRVDGRHQGLGLEGHDVDRRMANSRAKSSISMVANQLSSTETGILFSDLLATNTRGNICTDMFGDRSTIKTVMWIITITADSAHVERENVLHVLASIRVHLLALLLVAEMSHADDFGTVSFESREHGVGHQRLQHAVHLVVDNLRLRSSWMEFGRQDLKNLVLLP